MYEGISFDIKPGEILGFYGLVGSGRSEIARTLFGDMSPETGEIEFDGKELELTSCREAIDKGIAYLPEDRGTQGLFSSMSLIKNITTAVFPWIAKGGVVIDQEKERQIAQDYRDKLSIKTSSLQAAVNSLSGGNQQKVVLGRWLAAEPKLLILDEPTRGIDVATKSEVHKLILELASQGLAIMCISSDLDDIMNLADNIAVMHEGQIKDVLPREEATEEEILRLAINISKAEASSAN
jgi:ABC-type sugar transport system ATPase subunit